MSKGKLILFVISLLFITSCRIFTPSQMLRTGHDYKYSEFLASDSVQEYKIAVNDELNFKLATNNGEKIIDPVTESNLNNTSNNNNVNNVTGTGISYTVEFDGTIRLPVIGRIKLSGLTIREAEKLLEDSYTKYYNKPFVELKVTNNRVILFPGGEYGKAQVMPLINTNTTLFEALAMAGGISDGKAYKIKLIRGNLKNPKVYLIDLSTLEGMKKANLVLQANDIIYVKPKYQISDKVLGIITPYVSLLSVILLIFKLI